MMCAYSSSPKAIVDYGTNFATEIKEYQKWQKETKEVIFI
jgi:hypothetical protein